MRRNLEITGLRGLDLHKRCEKKVKQEVRKRGPLSSKIFLRFKNVCRVKPLVFGSKFLPTNREVWIKKNFFEERGVP